MPVNIFIQQHAILMPHSHFRPVIQPLLLAKVAVFFILYFKNASYSFTPSFAQRINIIIILGL